MKEIIVQEAPLTMKQVLPSEAMLCFCAGLADLVNIAAVVVFDVFVLYFWGIKSLAYLFCGNILGGGLHPMAGHLIAEHYTFAKVRSWLVED